MQINQFCSLQDSLVLAIAIYIKLVENFPHLKFDLAYFCDELTKFFFMPVRFIPNWSKLNLSFITKFKFNSIVNIVTLSKYSFASKYIEKFEIISS